MLCFLRRDVFLVFFNHWASFFRETRRCGNTTIVINITYHSVTSVVFSTEAEDGAEGGARELCCSASVDLTGKDNGCEYFLYHTLNKSLFHGVKKVGACAEMAGAFFLLTHTAGFDRGTT